MKKIVFISISAALLLGGCATKELNKDYSSYSKESYKNYSKNKMTMKNIISKENKIIHNKYIDLSIGKNLSSVLEELGKKNQRVYKLAKKSKSLFREFIFVRDY